MYGISGIWERNGCSLQDLKRRASAMKSLLAWLRGTFWHWAPVYASCGHIFNFFETMSGYKYEKAMFLKYVGYELDLTNPKSLNQKTAPSFARRRTALSQSRMSDPSRGQ